MVEVIRILPVIVAVWAIAYTAGYNNGYADAFTRMKKYFRV